MSYIRIIACPPGEAPLAVREAWIGLELPLSSNPLVGPGRRSFFTGGVISGPRGWWQTLVQLVRGQLARQSGYAVNALEAINTLATKNEAAAQWWRTHCPHLLNGRRNFVFSANSCEEC